MFESLMGEILIALEDLQNMARFATLESWVVDALVAVLAAVPADLQTALATLEPEAQEAP